ncbi:oligosaccharide flippase family protein [Silvibacterium dinghuense]|uniref:Polysaccharide biosynthesis protein n=1 Tax=Silvibacterium dinghuense TaxID=1560006 RepID=A0A4Q1SGU5_9BACT|nr:oligosaccharide flippase family protein [Silvibacterium dinghuense]RXS96758.1 polysaccharide biosynthesis protein [Silvibacterium dinghuense]GGG93397.1 lipopolysaccharide biosynthesis protein [Silvibacterium dinghuense]
MKIDNDIAPIPTEEDEGLQLRAVRSLEKKAVKGTYFVTVAYGLSLSLRLVSSIVLSRLFAPELFGVLALVTTFIVGLNLFSHIGLEASIIQNPRGDEPEFLNTAWTIQVIRGLGVFLLTIPMAWPVAHFYHEPRMIWLLPALGFGSAIAGFTSPSMMTLARHLGVGRLSLNELLQQVIQFAVTLIWALYQPSLIALVAGRIVSELIRMLVSYWMLPEIRPRFAWEKSAVHELITFGRWILIGTALTFLALQSDRLILGKLVTFSALGVYGIAFSLSDIPRQIILQFCSRVGFPFIAKFSDRPRPEYRTILRKYRLPVLAAGALLLIVVICSGDLFIVHVYDKRYHGAAWMIGILAIGLWHTLLYSTAYPAVLSLQKSHYNAFAYLVYCITLFVALPLGYHWFGMVGAVVAVAFSDLPVYFVTLFSAHREGVGLLSQDVGMTLAFLASLTLALLLRSSIGLSLPFAHIPW